MIPRELSPAEVSDLLAGNGDLQARVLQHLRIVDSGQWRQPQTADDVSWWPASWGGVDGTTGENLPIPTSGLVIQDPKYGSVVVFPDASGTLHFTADAPATAVQTIANQTPYTSPSGNTFEQYLADLKEGFGGIVAGLIVFGVVYLVVAKSLE